MLRSKLLYLAVAGALVLLAPPADLAQAQDAGGAVLRCLHTMPGVACELAGIAVRPPRDLRLPHNMPHKRAIVASGCGTTSSPWGRTGADDPGETEAADYCGGKRSTPRLADGGILVLEPAGGDLIDQGLIPLGLGYGGAAWGNGTDVWQAVYSDAKVARISIDLEQPTLSGIAQAFDAPDGGRVGGLAFDGGNQLFVHQTDLDEIFVLNATNGGVLRSLPVPLPGAVNGLAFEDGRLYAAINDDNMSAESTGHGPAQEAIVALDPATGTELARWNLPDGIDPHSMDRYGPGSLAVMVQTEPGPHAQMYLYEFVLPEGRASGMNNAVEVVPCQ